MKGRYKKLISNNIIFIGEILNAFSLGLGTKQRFLIPSPLKHYIESCTQCYKTRRKYFSIVLRNIKNPNKPVSEFSKKGLMIKSQNTKINYISI